MFHENKKKRKKKSRSAILLNIHAIMLPIGLPSGLAPVFNFFNFFILLIFFSKTEFVCVFFFHLKIGIKCCQTRCKTYYMQSVKFGGHTFHNATTLNAFFHGIKLQLIKLSFFSENKKLSNNFLGNTIQLAWQNSKSKFTFLLDKSGSGKKMIYFEIWVNFNGSHRMCDFFKIMFLVVC